jgi:hypothetical protein
MSTVTAYEQTYYDDYASSNNSDKNYLRILFKPGYSVQVREINQLQTALQDQINRLGSSVWKDNIAIVGGETTFLNKVHTVVLNIPDNVIVSGEGNPTRQSILSRIEYIEFAPTIGITTNKLRARVLGYKVVDINLASQVRFYISYENSILTTNNENIREFTLFTPGNTNYSLVLSELSSSTVEQNPQISGIAGIKSGLAFGVSSAKGIFYTRGSFVAVPEQNIFIDKDEDEDQSLTDPITGYATLLVTENIVNPNEDETLYDNAAGTPNYTAPGADRYQIDLSLQWLSKTDLDNNVNQEKYIKLLYVENSRVKEISYVDKYKEINTILAQRTREESGNYTVSPFAVRVRELYNGNNLPAGCIRDGKRYKVEDPGTTVWSSIGAGTSPAIGYEFIATANLLPEQRENFGTGRVTEVAYPYGTYEADDLDFAGYTAITNTQKVTAIEDATARFNLTVEPSVAYIDGNRVELISPLNLSVRKGTDEKKVKVNLGTPTGNYFIGSLSGPQLPNILNVDQVYTLYKSSTSIGKCKIKSLEPISGSSYYRCYIYDVTFSNNLLHRFDDVDTIELRNQSTVLFRFTVKPDTILNESEYNKNYFELPYDSAKLVNSVSCIGKRHYTGVVTAVSGNTGDYERISVTAPSSAKFIDFDDAIVLVNGQIYTFGSGVNNTWRYSSNGNTSITIESTGFDINHSYDIICPIKYSNITSATKTFATATDTIVLTETNELKIFKLSNTDVISIKKIVSGTDINNGLDLTASFELFDDGQRDEYYTNARIRYIGNGKVNTSITVEYEYFNRTFNDTIKFYDAKTYFHIDRNNTPAYKGKFLADVIDFRPDIIYSGVLTNQGSTSLASSTATATLDPNSSIELDVDFYLPRVDKLVVNSNNSFGIVGGISAFNPIEPETPPNSMALYTIEIPANTANINDIKLKYIDNRRYTMKDIGNIESRIRTVEYYTSLSLLERSTNEKRLFDENGERFKNGMLVDNFISHSVGDIFDKNYKCSIDRKKNLLRPEFRTRNVDLIIDSQIAQNRTVDAGKLKLNHSFVSLNFDEVELVSQLQATNTISVQPHILAKVEGHILLSPSSDNWKDTTTLPDLVIQDDSNFNAIKFIADNTDVTGRDFNSWFTTWSGVIDRNVDVDVIRKDGPNPNKPNVNRTETTVTKITELEQINQTRTGTLTTLTSSNVNQSFGESVRDINIIPFMRSRRVYFHATGFLPNTRLYAFFDGKNITDYAQRLNSGSFINPLLQASIPQFVERFDGLLAKDLPLKLPGVALNNDLQPINPDGSLKTAYADPLITDANGELYGAFVIPNNSALRFNTGDRRFRLVDDRRNDDEDINTFGEEIYSANGMSQVQQESILSTKVANFTVTPITESQVLFHTNTTVVSNTVTYKDPLAQSFVIESNLYKEGVFVTSVDLYFSKKGQTAPVIISILTMTNGYPAKTRVPYSIVSLNPSQVNISDDASLPTTFTFINPVFLKSNDEYCIYVESADLSYECYYAIKGKNDIVTNNPILVQEYLGVFFTSSNSQTWTAYQDRDLKFRIRRAKFKLNDGEIKFRNILHTGVDKITVTNFGVNYTLPPLVTINPDPTDTSNDIDAATAEATIDRVTGKITSVKVTKRGSGYTKPPIISFTNQNNGGGPGAGANPSAAYASLVSVPVSVYTLKQSSIVPPSTAIINSISFSGEDDVIIGNNTNNFIPSSYLANESNTISNETQRHATLTSVFRSNDDSLSPIIDIDGTSLLTIENIINSDSYGEGVTVYENSTSSAAGTTTTLIDNKKNWPANYWKNDVPSKLQIISAPGQAVLNGTQYKITANTPTTLTFAPATSVNIPSGTVYNIVDVVDQTEGNADAKYITKKVSLNNPSDRLDIFLSLNRPSENANIKVYVKFGYDTTSSDDSLTWELVNPVKNPPVSSNALDYKEVEYVANPLTDFISFQVKIVMLSPNIVEIPTIRDFRAIATI